MLTRSGAKLLDFGLAKLPAAPPVPRPGRRAPRSIQATGDPGGRRLGTLPYMAPEQLEGQDSDERTDIFAFGAVLYEMLTRRRAFAGKTEASVISAIMAATRRHRARSRRRRRLWSIVWSTTASRSLRTSGPTAPGTSRRPCGG